MRKILFFLLLSHNLLLQAFSTSGLDHSQNENEQKIFERHKKISRMDELNTFMKELDQLDQYTQFELIQEQDNSIRWISAKSPLIRQINISSGLRNKNLEKLTNQYIGKPNSPYTQQVLITELLDYLSYIGYPKAELRWEEKPSESSVKYNISIIPGPPCLIHSIFSEVPIPTGFPLPFEVGTICDREQIRENLENYEKTLSEEGFQNSSLQFGLSEYSGDYSKLKLILSGNIGTRINFEFIDESGFLLSNALDETTTSYLKKNYSNPFLVREQVYEYFTSRAYPFVKIRGPFKQIESDGSLTFLYYINKGTNYQIYDIVIEGNFQIPTYEIKDAVIISNFSDFFTDDDSKSEETIKKRILNFYNSKGFWDTKILRHHIEYSKTSNNATLYMTVDEGLQRKLKIIFPHGNKAVSNTEIEDLLKSKIDSPIQKDDLASLDFRIREKYFEQGYLDAHSEITVNNSTTEDNIEVTLDIKITEGSLFRIGTLSIKGLIDTKPYVVQRELDFKSGDIYKQDIVEKSRVALLNLGIFSSVSIERFEIPHLEGEEAEVDIILNIREGDAGKFKFGPGYNLTRGLQYAAEISYNNIAGTGRRITMNGALSQEKQQYSVSGPNDKNGQTLLGRKVGAGYTEPYFLTLPVNANVSVYHQAIADDIWKISNTLELSLSHTLNWKYLQGSVSPYYRYQLLEDEGTPTQKDSLVTTGFSKIGSVGIRYRLDKRNSLSFPSSGFLFHTELNTAQYPLLSEYRYYMWHIGNSYYHDIIRNLVFALNFNIKSYVHVKRKNSSKENVDVLPANQRLLAGGPNDVRGFSEQLGPYVHIKNITDTNSNETPLGASQLFIMKTELRHQIVPDLFSLSIFWDVGNSFFTSEELQTFNENFQKSNTVDTQRSVEDNFNYRFQDLLYHPEYLFTKNYNAIGLSIGLLTPLGALNASLGWPLIEPVSVNCRVNGICFPRSINRNPWIERVKLDFNIGAEF